MKRLLILLPLLLVLLPAPLQGQGGGRAGIVVQFGDGSVWTQCVSFAEESISGFELLQRSGLDVIAQSFGGAAAVCKIGSDGCAYPAEPCFCRSGGGQPTQYWTYWQARDGAWTYAAQGASTVRVRDGDLNGWAWGGSSAQPPLIPFGQICPVAASVPPTAPAPPTVSLPTVAPPSPPSLTPLPTIQVRATATPRPPDAPAASAPPIATAQPPTPEPPTATAEPTLSPTATVSQPTATVRQATATLSQATATVSQPTMTHTAEMITPTAAVNTVNDSPALVRDSQAETSAANYIIFGVMLTGVLGIMAFALRRR